MNEGLPDEQMDRLNERIHRYHAVSDEVHRIGMNPLVTKGPEEFLQVDLHRLIEEAMASADGMFTLEQMNRTCLIFDVGTENLLSLKEDLQKHLDEKVAESN